MKRLLAITFAASRLVACGGKGVPFPSGNPGRAKATLYSIYKRCGVGGSCLLRENHPFDAECLAGYVLSGDRACPNACSCLWPFSGTLSAVTAMPGPTLRTAACWREGCSRDWPNTSIRRACPRPVRPMSRLFRCVSAMQAGMAVMYARMGTLKPKQNR